MGALLFLLARQNLGGHRQGGFTLVEILVVVTTISLLGLFASR